MGYIIMISSSINKIYSELNKNKKKDILLLLSGSYAENISNSITAKSLIEPNFVLKSLALIEKYR